MSMYQFTGSDYSNEINRLNSKIEKDQLRVKNLTDRKNSMQDIDWFNKELEEKLNERITIEHNKRQNELNNLMDLFNQRTELEQTQTELMNKQNEILNNLKQKITTKTNELKDYEDKITTGRKQSFHSNSDIKLLEKFIAGFKLLFFILLIICLSLFIANRSLAAKAAGGVATA